MCTALTYLSGDFYMGRTLDYERGYGEEVVVTPRAYPFEFRHEGLCARHYAIIARPASQTAIRSTTTR